MSELNVSDGCPGWAAAVISKIMLIEIESGTIKNPMDATTKAAWSTAQLDELAKAAARLDHQKTNDLSQEVETLFAHVVRGLAQEGKNNSEIASIVNARIPTGCKLPYCSPQEISEVLSEYPK